MLKLKLAILTGLLLLMTGGLAEAQRVKSDVSRGKDGTITVRRYRAGDIFRAGKKRRAKPARRRVRRKKAKRVRTSGVINGVKYIRRGGKTIRVGRVKPTPRVRRPARTWSARPNGFGTNANRGRMVRVNPPRTVIPVQPRTTVGVPHRGAAPREVQPTRPMYRTPNYGVMSRQATQARPATQARQATQARGYVQPRAQAGGGYRASGGYFGGNRAYRVGGR